ncbi:hypothetical protein [uncultured Eubacterium sp.]|uniref:hypothetical protein n=1 Tax=uncultured Eubacterium sp. TaxID=165185 RepID=UPI002671CA99|nr:hypothetical protein [uncultured Eubacterium sp.]
MNRKKIISILMTLALTVSVIIPAFGQGGDGTGSTDWPYNLSISNSSLETTNYKLGTEKEFTIGYWPASAATEPLKGTRHITITGPEQVTGFQFKENDQWNDISLFETEITIKTSLTQSIKATFNKEGSYTIKFWVEAGKDSLEVSREFYVSDSGITRVPLAPLKLKESNKKYNFEWSWGSDLSVTFDLYIDGQKINDTPIKETKYNASEKADILSKGKHEIQVIAIHMLGDESIASEPAVLEYTAEAPTTQEPTTEEPTTVTEPITTEVPTTATEPATTETLTTVTEPATTETPTTVAEPESTQATTAPVITPVAAKQSITTKNSESVKVPQAKIKKAVKKKGATKAKIYLKKVKGIQSYEIQICKNKKFKKKNTVTKNTKRLNYTFKKLKTNKKYYVRARGVIKQGNIKITGKWSKIISVKFKK